MRGIARVVGLGCLLFVAGCGEPPPEAPKGYVSGANPDKVHPGELTVIQGQYLGNNGTVLMAGGKSAMVSMWTPNTIAVRIPEDQPAGPTTLEVRGQSGSLGSVSLKIVPAVPSLRSVEPEVAAVGDVVTLKGIALGEQKGSSIYVYGAKVETIKEWTASKVVFVVPELPADPKSMTVWIENEGGKTNEKDFAVVKPYASELAPDPALAGRTATIKGRDFGKKKGQVLVGEKKYPAEIVEWGENAIKIAVPDAVSGQVEFRVVNQNGTSIPMTGNVLGKPVLGRIGKAPGDQVALAIDDIDLPRIVTFDSKMYALGLTWWGSDGWTKRQVLITLGQSTGAAPRSAPDLEKNVSKILEKYQSMPGDPTANEAAMRAEIDKLTAEAQKAAASSKFDPIAAGMMPCVAIDASRRLHLVVWETRKEKLVYGTRSLDEEEWQFQYVDAAEGVKMGMASAIAVDSRGAVHLAYMDGTTRQVKHAVRRDGKFVTEVVDPEQDCGATVAIDVDKNGVPAVAYLDFGKFDAKAARFDGKAWKADRVEDKGWTGDMPALAMDDGGNPVVAYMVRSDDGKAAAGLKVAVYTGKGWVVETVDAGPGVGNQPQLKKDKLGRFHLAYCDERDGSIKYASRKGIVGAWDKQTMRVSGLPTELKPKQMALEIASDNTARLAYITAEGFLEYRQFSPK